MPLAHAGGDEDVPATRTAVRAVGGTVLVAPTPAARTSSALVGPRVRGALVSRLAPSVTTMPTPTRILTIIISGARAMSATVPVGRPSPESPSSR